MVSVFILVSSSTVSNFCMLLSSRSIGVETQTRHLAGSFKIRCRHTGMNTAEASKQSPRMNTIYQLISGTASGIICGSYWRQVVSATHSSIWGECTRLAFLLMGQCSLGLG